MTPKSSQTVKTSTPSRRILRIVAVLLGAGGLFAIGWYSVDMAKKPVNAIGPHAEDRQAKPSFGVLIGRWQRSDGGQILEIHGIAADGRMDCTYFNPNPVQVVRAEAVIQGDTLQIFIALEGKDFPRASLQLIYNPNQEILTGRYRQPAKDGTLTVTYVKTN